MNGVVGDYGILGSEWDLLIRITRIVRIIRFSGDLKRNGILGSEWDLLILDIVEGGGELRQDVTWGYG